MIKMVDKQKIIFSYRTLEHSKRRIASDLHLNRKTVERVIKEYELAIGEDTPDDSLEKLLMSKPIYNSKGRKKRVLTDEIISIINDCLAQNRKKSASNLHKQRMLKQDIYELLINKDLKISYSTVCNYIRSLKKKEDNISEPAFIRQHYEAGYACEFDWGDVKVCIKGKYIKFNMAVFTFSHSNGRYAYLFRHQNTLAYMESHRNFFRDVKGVPHQLVYDNMKVAVKSFTGDEKKPTEALMRLSSFYRFSYRFCNRAAGWEKGHVERSVEIVRRKAFSLKHNFTSIEEANNYLMKICSKLNTEIGSIATENKQEFLKADLLALKSHINDIGCFELGDYTVDKWSTITINKNHYSVPDYLVGKVVSVKKYSEKIVIIQDGKKIATHERLYCYGEWRIKLEHYVQTLIRKPGALASSVALKQMPQEVQEVFNKHFKNNPKDFVLLIRYTLEKGFSNEDLIMAYNTLIFKGVKHPCGDQIKTLMHSIKEPLSENKTEESNSNSSLEIESHSLVLLSDITTLMSIQKQSQSPNNIQS